MVIVCQKKSKYSQRIFLFTFGPIFFDQLVIVILYYATYEYLIVEIIYVS